MVLTWQGNALSGNSKDSNSHRFELRRSCAFLREVGHVRAGHRTVIVSSYCPGAIRYVLNRDELEASIAKTGICAGHDGLF
jgi:hypothetical protein